MEWGLALTNFTHHLNVDTKTLKGNHAIIHVGFIGWLRKYKDYQISLIYSNLPIPEISGGFISGTEGFDNLPQDWYG